MPAEKNRAAEATGSPPGRSRSVRVLLSPPAGAGQPSVSAAALRIYERFRGAPAVSVSRSPAAPGGTLPLAGSEGEPLNPGRKKSRRRLLPAKPRKPKVTARREGWTGPTPAPQGNNYAPADFSESSECICTETSRAGRPKSLARKEIEVGVRTAPPRPGVRAGRGFPG
jgi:hypothetical protein